MLVLTRRIGEGIVIDGEIRITVTAIRGDRVRIGITAPQFVRVDREEVHERRSAGAAETGPRALIAARTSRIHCAFIFA